MNERKQKAGKFKEKYRHYYCGAYQLTGCLVRALAIAPGLDEVASADIIHQIEAGEIAHTDLRVVLKPGNFDIENTKTAIGDRLWNACSGPLKHICDCDKETDPHPSATLSIPPAGPYADDRSYLRRRWHIFRYHVYSWLWRNSIRTAVPHPDARSRAVRIWSTITFYACRWLWRNCSGEESDCV
jgi:hypothetical protein